MSIEVSRNRKDFSDNEKRLEELAKKKPAMMNDEELRGFEDERAGLETANRKLYGEAQDEAEKHRKAGTQPEGKGESSEKTVDFPVYFDENYRPYVKLWEFKGDRDELVNLIVDMASEDFHGLLNNMNVRVRVRRTSGAMEDDWFLNAYVPEKRSFIVLKPGVGNKPVGVLEFIDWNAPRSKNV